MSRRTGPYWQFPQALTTPFGRNKRFLGQAQYPNEDVKAYVAAFLDPTLVVLMEDALPKSPMPTVKTAVRELAEKIHNSGGWKLVIGRYGIDKIFVGIAVREGAARSDDITKAVSDIIQQLMSMM